MDQTETETNDLEEMEERNNPISRIGETGGSEVAGTRRGRRNKSLAHVHLTCDKRSPKQRIFS
jgi:hypothetical protein